MEIFNSKLEEEKVFRDPIHRYVYVQDSVIKALIDSKEFQRLRRIKQLGTSSTTFHGAEHSRFNHSLGVYEITRRIIDEIFVGSDEWDNEERLLALCAGLLHDIGHGPFSHSFEKVFDLDHEDYSQKIIMGNTEVNSILQQVSADFPQKVASVIGKTYENKLVVSLISSQVDADRMDYLQRDAFYTGVSYGKFDMERMLRVIRPSKDGLLIKASGVHVVEDYIMSRYQMYLQIYFHPASSSNEVILTKIFDRVKELYRAHYAFETAPKHFMTIFEEKVTVHDYLTLDEAVCTFYFSQWQNESDEILSDLCKRFLNRNLFRYIEFADTDENRRIFEELKQLFHAVGINSEYYLSVNASSNVGYDEYMPSDKVRQPVSLLLADGRCEDLSMHSSIVATIMGKRAVFRYLYFPKELIKALPTSKEKDAIMQLLKLK